MSPVKPSTPFDLAPPEERGYFERWGNGLVVVLPPRRPGPSGWGAGGPPHGGAWIHLGEDGRVRAFSGKAEVGQGTRTALALLVAEELRVPLASVEMMMGDTDTSPWDMGTFGSRSMPDAGEHLRTTAAAARDAIRKVAADRLELPADQLELRDGHVRGPGGVTVPVADLMKGLRRIETVGPSATPTPPARWSVAGHAAAHPFGREIVTGQLRYASDLHPEGMQYGKILFPPQYGAKLLSVDLVRARALPGVTAVQEGDLVAVAAPTLRTAAAALAAIRTRWEMPAQPSESEIEEYLRSHTTEAEDAWDVVHHETGDATTALAAAPVRVEETYTAAYIAHIPMETHCALAAWDAGRLTVWMGTQTPFRARDRLSDALEIPPSSVRVVVPPTGSGFGGKHDADVAVAAARLAKAARRPVRVAFTREEEFARAYLRPLAVIEIRSGALPDGTLTAWTFRVLNAGSAAARPPYAIPNQSVSNQPADSPLPQGSYRALAATANNFARESHVDEVASRVGADPMEFRLRHLADDRLAAVLKAVAHRVGWTPRPGATRSRTLRSGHGRGIAVGLEKGARVTTYAEVTVDPERRLSVDRIVTALECGAIVHPTNLYSQVEGGTVMALGGALFEAVHFEGGKIVNPRFSEYRVPRFRDVPPIEVMLLDRPDIPSAGAGETPLIAVAPAIANAVYDATGVRLRSMPLVPDGFVP